MLSNSLQYTCEKIRKETNINIVALSGGVFQNRFLLKRLMEQLANLNIDTNGE